MLPRPQGIVFSKMARAGCLALVIVPCCLTEPSAVVKAAEPKSNILCREDFPLARRQVLAAKLRKITGWPDLEFDSTGALRIGDRSAVGGSPTAREFVEEVMRGPAVVVLENASRSSDIAFCQVNPGRWKAGDAYQPSGYVVKIDFTDFEQVIGDGPALEAFDAGWGLLHELDHVVNDSRDATGPGGAGECEAQINQMRRECNLPQRADYFFTFLPVGIDTSFVTKLVRVAFDQEQTPANKRRRYWVLWDANVVGGLTPAKQIASLR